MESVNSIASQLASRRGMVITLILCLLVVGHVTGNCGGNCGACARRYGCLTPAWGKCCTQFFMHNGKKRSSNNVMERLIEYVRLKHTLVDNDSAHPEALKNSLKLLGDEHARTRRTSIYDVE